MRFTAIVLAFGLGVFASAQNAGFVHSQCKQFKISTGGDGEGILRYCDNGTDQRIYLSGEMDSDENGKMVLRSLNAAIRQFKKRTTGKFEVITKNAGGGDTEWHQKLIMAVEDSCLNDCKIVTEVHGFCESACNQLHITCVKNAKTIIRHGGKTCEHATTDSACKKCDPNPPKECDICGAKESVAEYKDRCGKLLKGRKLEIDEARKRVIFDYVDLLAARKVFDTSKFTCNNVPWAEVETAPAGGTAPAPGLAR